MRKSHLLVLALLVATVLAITATTPPRAKPADSPQAEFSAGRAMVDVRRLAQTPHITATPENAAVRAYLAQRMAALGLEVSESSGTVGEAGTAKRNRWTGRNDPPVTLTNLIGVLPGRNRTLPAIALMAHHDSVWGSPAAADDAAGIAASLEVARAIKAGGGSERDIILLMTDAEELGLEGAEQFFANHPLRRKIGAVINMEARGGGGRTTLFQTSRENGEAIALYADAVRKPAASSLSAFVYSVLPNDTDLTPVIAGETLAYNFAFIGRSGLYHSPLATAANLDEGALQDMGGQVLDLTRALAAAPVLPRRSADVVFFDMFGWFTVSYPAWWGWPMLAAALVALVAAGGRRGGLTHAGQGALRALAVLLLGGALLYALNVLSIGSGKAEYYDRLAEIPQLELMAMLASAATVLATLGGWPATRQRFSGFGLALVVLGVAAQWFAPTAAYVIVVPVLLVSVGLYGGKWASGIAAAMVVGYMIALGHQLMQGVGPSMPMAAALPLAIAAFSILPLWPAMVRRHAVISAAVLLCTAGAVALWVQANDPAITRAAYADSKS